jgi:hypothetical protein
VRLGQVPVRYVRGVLGEAEDGWAVEKTKARCASKTDSLARLTDNSPTLQNYFTKNKKRTCDNLGSCCRKSFTFNMVRKRGFEPLRSCERQPLKLVRLPFRHFRKWGPAEAGHDV